MLIFFVLVLTLSDGIKWCSVKIKSLSIVIVILSGT